MHWLNMYSLLLATVAIIFLARLGYFIIALLLSVSKQENTHTLCEHSNPPHVSTRRKLRNFSIYLLFSSSIKQTQDTSTEHTLSSRFGVDSLQRIFGLIYFPNTLRSCGMLPPDNDRLFNITAANFNQS